MTKLLVLLGLPLIAAAGTLSWYLHKGQDARLQRAAERGQIAADYETWNKCIATVQALPDAQEQIKHILSLDQISQRIYIERQGWAVGPDGKTTYNAASFCAVGLRVHAQK